MVMIHILCAHLTTRRLVADVVIDSFDSIGDLKALVLKKLSEGELRLVQVGRWLVETALEGHTPIMAEVSEKENGKVVGAVGLRHYSILYLDAPSLPISNHLRPLRCFWEAFTQPSIPAVSAEIAVAIVTRLSSLEANIAMPRDDIGWDNDGASPLMLAVTARRADVAMSLVAVGVDVDFVGTWRKHSVLHIAARAGAVPLVEFLLSAGAKLECRDVDGKTPLWHAAEMGNSKILGALLAAGANVDTADHYGRTPLFVASERGHIVLVDSLLAAGANVEAADNYGKTPLHIAAENKRVAVVKALLERNANTAAVDKLDHTALHRASDSAVVVLLIAADANLEAADNQGRTPSHTAAHCGRTAALQALLAAGTNIETVDKRGQTALYVAASRGHVAEVEALLTAGANVEACDGRGRTSLVIATCRNRAAVVKALRANLAALPLTKDAKTKVAQFS